MTQYRMLKEGEIIKNGDEFVPLGSKDEWLKAGDSIGDPLESDSVGYYRRRIHSKIKPKETKTMYRFLKKFETIQKGDETNLEQDWVPLNDKTGEWRNANSYCGHAVSSDHVKNFRRKIKLTLLIEPPPTPEPTFLKEVETLVNRYSQENNSNTPDFILADYIKDALEAFNNGIKARDKWYSIDPRPGWSKPNV